MRQSEKAEELVANPEVARKLDHMARDLKSEEAAEAPVLKRPRPRGQPRGGRAKFTRLTLNRLPESGFGPTMSKYLGVSRMTLYDWTRLEENPLPCETVEREHCKHRKQVYLFRKKDIIKWMIATRRYVPRR